MQHRLGGDERQRLETDGYVVRANVFSRSELAAMIAASEALVADLVRDRRARRHKVGSYTFDPDLARGVMIKWEGDSDVVHGIEPFAHLSPALHTWALDPRCVDPMQDLIGDASPILFTEKLNLKRPRHGGENPLHQDYPYWDGTAGDAKRVATAMVFLDDATLENGCLHVVPGSHTAGTWQRRTDTDEFGRNEIDSSAYPEAKLAPLEVEAGAVVFFGPFLVHRSAPNRSDRERRALLWSYQPPGHPHMLDLLRRAAAEREAKKRR
jgi:ectoine hydroxylase-related dioxygenase (phytanoyl-CoA dioxygenase family)